jgi:hypothetical protein
MFLIWRFWSWRLSGQCVNCPLATVLLDYTIDLLENSASVSNFVGKYNPGIKKKPNTVCILHYLTSLQSS